MIPDPLTDFPAWEAWCREANEAARLRFILARVALGTVGYAHFAYDKPAPGEQDVCDPENG
jgi:hypothetical protein